MFGAKVLQTLSARPPTPPRDTHSDEVEQGLDQALEFLNDTVTAEPAALVPLNTIRHSNTPEYTPNSSAERLSSSRATSNTVRKVNFAPFILWGYHNSPVHPPTVQTLPVKPLAPSRNCFSRKSILKPFKMTTIIPATVQPYDTLQSMLEDTVDTLRGGDIATRANAYSLCLHTLQDFNSFPDTQSLADHSNQLLYFIRKDMEIELTSSAENSKVAVSAIKLLITLIRLPESAAWFDQDKLADAVEFSVSMIQLATAPKTILTHHLFFLSQQKFNSRIMTADRINRTITALTTIHEKIPGNGVRAHRLLIYRRFVDQSPTVMRSRAGDWIVNLFTSILSQKRDVREQGIELGYTTALQFGNKGDISRMVQELLDKEFEKKSFGRYAIERLQDLLKQKDLCVPRIWAIVVLFLRGRNRMEGHWNWFKPWLELASACVNSAEKQIKIETIVAWRKLIFACMPDAQTIKAVRHLLKAPIEAHLKKEQDFSSGLGKHAISTYFCLLHYSLRAGTLHEQMDSYWEEYVEQMINTFISKSDDKVIQACSILQSIFRMPLKPGAISIKDFEPSQFDFEEPPTLEPRWIRSRLSKVIRLANNLLLRRISWTPIDLQPLENSPQRLEHLNSSAGMVTWMSLMDAVCEAGIMEVTTSLELKSAISAIVNSLHLLAQSFRHFDSESFSPGQVFASLVHGTLQRLGPSHFAERMLMRTSNDAFEVAPTPSQRSKSGGALVSPLTHLFILQLSLPSEGDMLQHHFEHVKSIVMQCYDALKSRGTKLELLGDLSEALESFKDDSGAMSDMQQDVADLLLELGEDTMLSDGAHIFPQPSINSSDITALSRILQHLTCFLTASRLPRVLYTQMIKAARTISGDAGVLLLVTEPQSQAITSWLTSDTSISTEMLIAYATMIVDNDNRPRLGSMERARKQIWGGVSGNVDKFQDADLIHTNIWNLMNTTLTFGYDHLGESVSIASALAAFVDAMQRHIGRSVRSFQTLVKFTQKALAIMLLDEQRKLKDVARTPEGARLPVSILALWTEITSAYRHEFKQLSPASNWLDAVQDLILAGFNSPRKSIVNITISFWNDFVDKAGELLLDIDYPDKMIDAALYLRSIGDVHLPPSHDDKENEIESSDRTFIAFSDYGSQPSSTPISARLFGAGNHRRLLPPLSDMKGQHKLRSPVSKFTPRRKLRHEDSQITFEPIEASSPIRAADETQNLTEHQKDVLARQQNQAAALFGDIGSDVIGESSHRIEINSDVAVASSDTGKDQTSRPSTPDVGGQDGLDEEAQSSPITASQSRRHNRSSSSNRSSGPVLEIPSSPPAAVKPAQPSQVVQGGESSGSDDDVIMLDQDSLEQELPDTLLDVIPDTVSVESLAAKQQAAAEEHADEVNIGGYRISSDDLPSSQLVAEMLASQSSPQPSIELEEEKTNASQSSPPEQLTDSRSTASLMRAQTTLDDLFPSSFAHSSEAESQGLQYQTRSKTVRAASLVVQLSADDERASLKRKRGRPKKQTSVEEEVVATEFDQQSTDPRPASMRTRQSSSRLSPALIAQAQEHTDSSVESLEPSSRNRVTRRSSAQVEPVVDEEQIEAAAATAPSSKRRKIESAGTIDAALLPTAVSCEAVAEGTIQILSSSQQAAVAVGDADVDTTELPQQTELSVVSQQQRPMLTPKGILARLQTLLADAKSVVGVWDKQDQMEICDLSFELQAAARGYCSGRQHVE